MRSVDSASPVQRWQLCHRTQVALEMEPGLCAASEPQPGLERWEILLPQLPECWDAAAAELSARVQHAKPQAFLLKPSLQWQVAHIFNPSTGRAEAGVYP